LKTIEFTAYDAFAGDYGSRTSTKYVDVLGPPNPPINIQVTPYHQKLKVEWNEPSSGVTPTSYTMFVENTSIGGETFFIYDIPFENASDYNNGNGHNITNLTDGITYNITMYSNHTTYGQGDASDIKQGTPGHTPPDRPVIQSPSQGSYVGQSFELDWNQPTTYDGASITNYTIYKSDDGSIYTQIGITSATYYIVGSLTNGETYYFKLQAHDNQSGDSQNSTVKSYTVDDINPTTPVLESLPETSRTKTATLNWSASTDDESGLSHYVIEESISLSFDDDDLIASVTVSSDVTNKTFSSNHDYGRTYYFRIRAVDNAGNKGSWNGPVSIKFITNEYTGTKITNIYEIWFHSTDISVNNPVSVTVRVDDKYSIPSGYVTYEVGDIDTTMYLSSTAGNSYSYTATWEPSSVGLTDFKVQVVNSNNAQNSITIPVDVSRTNSSTQPKVIVHEVGEDTYVAASFSTSELDVSSYQDEIGSYHISFNNDPEKRLTIDLTNLESSYQEGGWWIFDFEFMSSNILECIVHGNKRIKDYKIEAGYTVDGYNDFSSKLFGWLLGTDFTLVERTSSYMTLTSLENIITCET